MKVRSAAAALIVLAAASSQSFAADLPSRKAEPLPPPPPPPLWTGFYLGVNMGYTWAENSAIAVDAFPGPCTSIGAGCTISPNFGVTSAQLATFGLNGGNGGGFLGGGQIGYNFQVHPNVVVGVETDIQGVAGGSSNSNMASMGENPVFAGFGFPLVNTASMSRSLDYLGTVRGRAGWLVTPELLVYGTGGLAYGGVTANGAIGQQVLNQTGAPFTAGNPYFASASFSDTRVGWTVGGGLEWMFWPNWSAKVEYLYYDLGSVTVGMTPLANFQSDDGSLFSSAFPALRTRFDGHIVRLGLNYHFNVAAFPPIFAK